MDFTAKLNIEGKVIEFKTTINQKFDLLIINDDSLKDESFKEIINISDLIEETDLILSIIFDKSQDKDFSQYCFKYLIYVLLERREGKIEERKYDNEKAYLICFNHNSNQEFELGIKYKDLSMHFIIHDINYYQQIIVLSMITSILQFKSQNLTFYSNVNFLDSLIYGLNTKEIQLDIKDNMSIFDIYDVLDSLE